MNRGSDFFVLLPSLCVRCLSRGVFYGVGPPKSDVVKGFLRRLALAESAMDDQWWFNLFISISGNQH